MADPHHSSNQDGMRINKYIAHAGVCSRRDADDLVEQGRVTLDGEPATHGDRVMEGQTVKVDGEAVYLKPFDYILLNKPKNTISTTDDPKDRNTVLDAIGVPPENPDGLFPVGRLDRNTTGLLLVTNDGDLAHRLMHPRYEIAKIYYVRTRADVKPHELDELTNGVKADGEVLSADRSAYINPQKRTDIALELHEGRNRHIRRMLESMGHAVVQLDRVKYAGFTKGALNRGEWRRLSNQEVRSLRKRVNLK